MAELRPLARLPGRPKSERPKERITIRFDQDVMAAFRATGPGWQTRMNDVLREYVERQM
ncbi:MAG: BrnA antitoxin family protein [Chromatiales bacterium]|nr:BrnA antitoxin family protein [Chromatiales bacterium]